MNPRPFYRSRLFWLGLPGLVFLLWSWWDSVGENKGVAWTSGGVGTFAYISYSVIGVGTDSGGRHYEGLTPWKNGGLSKPAFPSPVILREPRADLISFEVPLWLLILLYLVAWPLTLGWWQRRKSRILKLHAAP
jgi:hypothetical protein